MTNSKALKMVSNRTCSNINHSTGKLITYRNSLRMALKDRNLKIQVGFGTGYALTRGVSPTIAYNVNQPVCLTNDDLGRGGIIIMGGTGSGKTFSVIIPFLAQIMRAPFDYDDISNAISGGYKLSVSVVTYDPKGVLHADANILANNCGWVSRNIGIEEGEYGMDLIDGLSPSLVSTLISEAISQVNKGGGKDSSPIFASMGFRIIYASAVIQRVNELTDEGLAEVEKTGERLYSLIGIRKLAMASRSRGGYIFKVIENIIRNIRISELRPFIAPLCGPELIEAIDFLRRDVLTLFSEVTVGGFLANVSDAMTGFASENDIRERFGSARGNILDVDRLWDHKVVTNFRLDKVKNGNVAAIITIMAKVRQYHWAARRLAINPAIGKMSKQIICMDECQELVTKGGSFSEAQFINMSRAMGLSFIMATQTLSALNEAIGKEAVLNMMAQLRSKVFLSSEDKDTLSYLQSMIGTTLQTHIYKDDQYESRLTWRKERLGTIDDYIVSKILSDEDILTMSHPLVHGRVEPLICSQIDRVGGSFAQNDTEAYEAAFIYGEEWYKKYSPQGRIVAFAANTLKGIIPSNVANDIVHTVFTPTQVYTDLKMAVGEAIVVINRATLMRHDKIRLTPEFGFLKHSEEKNIMDDVSAQEFKSTQSKTYAVEKINKLRDENAVLPTLLA